MILPVDNGSFCLPVQLPRGFFRYWIPMLSFECLLCVLAIFQGFLRFRSDISIFRSGKRLVSNLIRDSVLYFLVIFATYLTCLLIWVFARRTFIAVPVGFSVTMSCVLANRVVLNSRKFSKRVTCSSAIRCPTSNRTTMIYDDDIDIDDDDDGVTNDSGCGKNVFSCHTGERGWS